jgi:hypothetical protein
MLKALLPVTLALSARRQLERKQIKIDFGSTLKQVK